MLQVTEMRFKAKDVGSSPSVVMLRVKNTGVLALDFLLKYPRDDEDEPENWSASLPASESAIGSLCWVKGFAVSSVAVAREEAAGSPRS